MDGGKVEAKANAEADRKLFGNWISSPNIDNVPESSASSLTIISTPLANANAPPARCQTRRERKIYLESRRSACLRSQLTLVLQLPSSSVPVSRLLARPSVIPEFLRVSPLLLQVLTASETENSRDHTVCTAYGAGVDRNAARSLRHRILRM